MRSIKLTVFDRIELRKIIYNVLYFNATVDYYVNMYNKYKFTIHHHHYAAKMNSIIFYLARKREKRNQLFQTIYTKAE